jgi:hypothetical protein
MALVKEVSQETMDRASRIVVIVYAVVAVINVLSFLLAGYDMNKLAVAALLLALIGGQKSMDAWRESAMMWRISAENWRVAADTWREEARRHGL